MNSKVINYFILGFIIVILVLLFFIFKGFIVGEDEIENSNVGNSDWSKKREFVLEIRDLNTSEEIMDFINKNFEVVQRDDKVILSFLEVYVNKKGTEADLLRLTLKIMALKDYQGSFLVYEYGGEEKFLFPFRDLDIPKYYYFEGGVLKMDTSGWSFQDTMEIEEKRQKILIDRFGLFFEGDVRGENNLTIQDVQEWVKYEK